MRSRRGRIVGKFTTFWRSERPGYSGQLYRTWWRGPGVTDVDGHTQTIRRSWFDLTALHSILKDVYLGPIQTILTSPSILDQYKKLLESDKHDRS